MNNTYLQERATKLQASFTTAKDKALKKVIDAVQELLVLQGELSQELTEITKLMNEETTTEEVKELPAAGGTTEMPQAEHVEVQENAQEEQTPTAE